MRPASRARPHAGTPVWRLDVVYTTPEGEYLLDDLWPLAMATVACALYACWCWWAVLGNSFDWPLSWRALAATNGVTGAVIAAYYVTFGLRALARALRLPGTTGRLRGEFTRGRFRLHVGTRRIVFDADRPHQFFMCAHPRRAEEGRAEERARRYGAMQLANHYRRAWQIVLDYRGARYLLAAVADEADARELVRRLQASVALAAGETDRDLRSPGLGSVTPSGTRPHLE